MNPWTELGKLLLLLGLGIAAAGLALLFWDKLPGLSRLPLGRLPGDINVTRGDWHFSFPLATCLVVSILVSLVLWLFRR